VPSDEDVARGLSKRQKRGPLDYVRDIGQARAMQLIQDCVANHEGYLLDPALATKPESGHKWSLDLDTGCWLRTSSLSSIGGAGAAGSGRYGVTKLYTNQQLEDREKWGIKIERNSGTHFQWHIVSYLAKHGKNLLGECSHLCHRSACFNPSHLVDEDHATNLSRRGCLGPIWCIIHDHLVLDLCQHEPKCIKPYYRDDMPYLRCCLSAKEEEMEQSPPFIKASQLPISGSREGESPATESGSSGWGNLTSSFLQEGSEDSKTSNLSQLDQSNASNLAEPVRRKLQHREDIRAILMTRPESLPGAEALEWERRLEKARDYKCPAFGTCLGVVVRPPHIIATKGDELKWISITTARKRGRRKGRRRPGF